MTIRDVSQEDRDLVAAKAERSGPSLQTYLLALVHEHATRDESWQLLERHRAELRRLGGGSTTTPGRIVELVHEARGDR